MRILVDRGARLNNALLCAVDNYDMVEFLLSRVAKIIAAPGKISAITNAAGAGDTKVARMLRSHADDAELNCSRDALNWAAAGGRLDTVNLLIEQGFDVNVLIKDCSIGETSLLAVCQAKEPCPHIIRTLLDRGANISIQSSSGDTPRKSPSATMGAEVLLTS